MIRKRLFAIILIVCFTVGLMSCGSKQTLDKLQNENKDWLSSVYSVIPGDHLALQDNIKWGISMEDVKSIVGGPYESDYETYISKWIQASLPVNNDWKGDSKSINAKAFEKTEMLAYYAFSEEDRLIEYGYQYFSPVLAQYNFLKEYYSKKYGEPKEEEYTWRDESYKPTGKEDLGKMFEEGKVKVMAAWDIDELGSVLVVDWLNDPVKLQNNFGQISFYQKTGELTLGSSDAKNNE